MHIRYIFFNLPFDILTFKVMPEFECQVCEHRLNNLLENYKVRIINATSVCVFMCVCMCVCMDTCICVHTWIDVYLCIHGYMYMYMCTWMCIYMWPYPSRAVLLLRIYKMSLLIVDQ